MFWFFGGMRWVTLYLFGVVNIPIQFRGFNYMYRKKLMRNHVWQKKHYKKLYFFFFVFKPFVM